MSIVSRCNCDFQYCKFPRNMRNAHVDDKCIHASGIIHKISNNVLVS